MIDILMSLVIFDLDNTIVKGQSQLYLLFFARKKRLINLIDFLVTLLWFGLYKINFVKDPQIIVNYVYKKVLTGRTVDEMNVAFADFFSSILKFKISNTISNAIKDHQQNNDQVVIMSNAISPIVRGVAGYLHVSKFICTNLEIVSGKYTGHVVGEIVYGQRKADLAREIFGEELLSLATFYSDHNSDIPLFDLVKIQKVVNPDKILLDVAKGKNWQIINA